MLIWRNCNPCVDIRVFQNVSLELSLKTSIKVFKNSLFPNQSFLLTHFLPGKKRAIIKKGALTDFFVIVANWP